MFLYKKKNTWSHDVCEIGRFFPLVLQSFVASWSLGPQLYSFVQAHHTATTSYIHPPKATGFSTKKWNWWRYIGITFAWCR